MKPSVFVYHKYAYRDNQHVENYEQNARDKRLATVIACVKWNQELEIT